MDFLSHVNDYIEPMVTFTTWAKVYSAKYFCNARVAGLCEIFVEQKFSAVHYLWFEKTFNYYSHLMHTFNITGYQAVHQVWQCVHSPSGNIAGTEFDYSRNYEWAQCSKVASDMNIEFLITVFVVSVCHVCMCIALVLIT